MEGGRDFNNKCDKYRKGAVGRPGLFVFGGVVKDDAKITLIGEM